MSLLHLDSLPRKVSRAELLALVSDRGGLDRHRVGRIELEGQRAVIEVPEGWAPRLASALDGQLLGNRRLHAWADRSAEPPLPGGGEDHFQRLGRLLTLESRAEAEQVAERARKLSPAEAERAGTSLVDLIVTEDDTGLGGRYLLRLVKRSRRPLPWTRLDTGSPVVLSPFPGKQAGGFRGVIFERTPEAVRVALGGVPDEMEDHDAWRLDLADNDVAARRQHDALRAAGAARGERLAALRETLLGRRPPEFGREQDEPPLDAGLNECQLAAVRFALAARDVALIHGPPGTGKTTAVVEVIRRAVARGDKVLACAPSNLGVDNVFERLLAAGTRAVRLGHPARVLPQLRDRTLDLLVQEHPDVRLARKLVKDALGLFRSAGRTTRARPEPGARQQARQEARGLLADARRLEAQAVEHILDTADVLCATTTGLDRELLGPRRFDLAVIDEACQSTEPGCWIPLLRADRVVLAGDHCQLPPTVVSREAAAAGLSVSLFERLVALHGPGISRLLAVQYRMHRAIMEFSSQEFYQGQLVADPSVADHVLAGLPHVRETAGTDSAVEFLDTAGAGCDEAEEADGESRFNPGEGEWVCRKVRGLLDAGVEPEEIAAIAPYAAQVRWLREQLAVPGLEIDSVDGFQGREKEAVVISLVRSNPRGEIGFLGDVRRMNVALTRARRKLIVIGDSATLAGHPFYRGLIEYFESLGAYRSVWEESV